MEKEADVKQVVEIDIDKKYIMVLPENTPEEAIKQLDAIITRWLDNDKPILFLSGNIELWKVSDDE